MITTLSAKVLGQRIRLLRIRHGLTQQDLAGDDYSKSYISAIEQGKTRPSLMALQRIAAKLEVPAGALLDPEARGFGALDPNALPRRVRRRRGMRPGPGGFISPAYTEFQIAQAELLIALGLYAQALEILRPMVPAEGEQASRPMEAAQVLRVYHLAAKATLHQEDLTEAFDYLRRGLQIAEQIGDREEQLRLRNLLGVAHFRSGQVLSALEEHRICLEGLRSGTVQDPNLRLAVYNNIARDYIALHDDDRAMATYRDALQLLEEVNSLERQANGFKALATIYSNVDDYSTASRYATKAAGLYQALGNMQQVVRMQNKYANLLIRAGEIEQAQQYLTSALELAEELSSDLDRALLLTSLAQLSLERGNLKDAQERIEQAVQISRQALHNIETTGDAGTDGKNGSAARYRYGYTRSEARQILANALSTAGEVAARQGDDHKTDRLFEEAIKLLNSLEPSDVSSDIYQRYARLLADRGQHERAATYFERAYRAVTKRAY
jgi:tetratricopeptide (TPR) repeat protein